MNTPEGQQTQRPMTRQAKEQRALKKKGICLRCWRKPAAVKSNGKRTNFCEECRGITNKKYKESKAYSTKVARPGSGSGRKKKVPASITAHGGLLYKDGHLLHAEAADAVAGEFQFLHAEQLVRHLERTRPTSGLDPKAS